MSIKQVRLSQKAKLQLIRLKSKTGIENWNILCRWAFCVSINEKTKPSPHQIALDSNVEMTWQIFGGENHEIYLSILKKRCLNDGLDIKSETLNNQFKLHLHRGISYLATPKAINSINDLIKSAIT